MHEWNRRFEVGNRTKIGGEELKPVSSYEHQTIEDNPFFLFCSPEKVHRLSILQGWKGPAE